MQLHSLNGTMDQALDSLRKARTSVLSLSVCLYDRETESLRVYSIAGQVIEEFQFFKTSLNDYPFLLNSKEHHQRFMVKLDRRSDADDGYIHNKLFDAGVRHRITQPLYNEKRFLGFLFFDFGERTANALDFHIDMISLLIQNSLVKDLQSYDSLYHSLQLVKTVTHYRDNETANHLERMSRYAQIISRACAEKYNLNREFVENVYRFSGLHDIGKMAIPDSILLKPGRLSPEEINVMRSHSTQGDLMTCKIAKEIGLYDTHDLNFLRSIVRSHHECLDGTGYPDGLKGEEVPLQSRIVAVADVFDALTSERPYKRAWTTEESLTFFRENKGTKFDNDCVDILHSCLDDILEVQARFSDKELQCEDPHFPVIGMKYELSLVSNSA